MCNFFKKYAVLILALLCNKKYPHHTIFLDIVTNICNSIPQNFRSNKFIVNIIKSKYQVFDELIINNTCSYFKEKKIHRKTVNKFTDVKISLHCYKIISNLP